MGTLGTLIYVQKDAATVAVIRRGRWSLERDAASSVRHITAAVTEAWSQMQKGLALMGYTSTGGKLSFVRAGDACQCCEVPVDEAGKALPLLNRTVFHPHLDFAPASTAPALAPNPDPLRVFDPSYQQEIAAYEMAEKARLARRSGLEQELVDFILRAPFRYVVRGNKRVHIPEPR